MVHFMSQPRNKLTLGSTVLENIVSSAKIQRVENGFDTATFILPSTTYYPSTATAGTTVLFEVKNSSEPTYTTLFAGIVRFAIADISSSNNLTLSCLSIGSGLSEMLVAAEYGDQTSNGLDSITEIITDGTYGIIPVYVEKILGGDASNYDYDVTKVETITDNITYINFPYKPADKALNDLCDLVTAVRAGSSGPHWIVTYAGGSNYLRVKYVDGTQVGWTKYYGDSQTNATLTYGVDYTSINLEKLAPEANYVVYYGAWRRPSNGDYWTENTAATLWGVPAGSIRNNSSRHVVGGYSVQGYTSANPTGTINIAYPNDFSAGWDFSGFTDFNTPALNFYTYYDLTNDTTLRVRLYTDAGNYYTLSLTPPNQQWQHYSIPVGPYFNMQGTNNLEWSNGGTSPDWADINYVEFYVLAAEMYNAGTDRYAFCIDGLHFGDANICRVASLADYTGLITRQRIVVDNVGKDDSLIDGDDSGLMAQLAYSELLRLNTSSTVGTLTTPMIKDLLPGQWLYIQSTDYRVPKLTHFIDDGGYRTQIEVTSDVVNSRPRSRFEDVNKQFASIRPEWQDRQAANMKAGSVDWRIARLVKTYA